MCSVVKVQTCRVITGGYHMAKYEKVVHGDFDDIINKLHDAVMKGSMSASYEDGSNFSNGDFQCAVRTESVCPSL